MTQDEFERLWGMMRGLWTRTENMKNPPKKQIWQMALEPYNAKDVQAAVVKHARASKFFPDIADITASLQPEIPADEEADAKPGSSYAQWHIPPGQEFQHNYAVLCEIRELEKAGGEDESFDDYLFRKYPKAWTQRQKAKAKYAQWAIEHPEHHAKLEAEKREIEESVRDKLRKEHRI